MIKLDVYTVTAGCIIIAAGVSFYKEWKFGHDLAMMCREEICEFMKNRGYEVRLDNYNTPYFVKGDKRYSYAYVHDLATENKLNEI